MKDLKILIADDSTIMRDMIKAVLKNQGVGQLDEVDNGVDAWEKIAESCVMDEPYGLVLIDWIMPEMEGIELLRKMRSDDLSREIPFIMITSEVEDESQKEAADLEVDAYVIKPFRKDELLSTIQSVLNSKQKAS